MIQELTLKMVGGFASQMVEVEQLDSNTRSVKVHLDGYEIPDDGHAVIYVKKLDGHVTMNDCTIEDASTVLCPITSQSIACCGKQKAQLYFYGSDWNIKSQPFYINIPKMVYDENAVESSDEFGTLTNLINTIEGLDNIFVAEYGVTTLEELQEAWNAGKCLMCKREVYIYTLNWKNGNEFYFRYPSQATLYECRCLSDGTWVSGGFKYSAIPTSHADTHSKDGDDPISPESIGAVSAVGMSITDPTTNIDNLVTSGFYLCGATVIKSGLLGDLPFNSSFFLKVEDFNGSGTRVVQTAYLNNQKNPAMKWRNYNSGYWSAWQDG